tara:strand:- start:947 stop:1393 length:447 start_codon:yes stop_codon:yes gene_type:complete
MNYNSKGGEDTMSVENIGTNNKPGPKPKKIVEATIKGIAVGRDKKVIPPDDVEKLAALGCRDNEISNYFGIKEDTLRYNFADNLTKGREDLKITLRRAMLNNACKNMNASVQIFLAKNLLGMADQPLNQEDNQPLPWVETKEQNDETT